MRYFSTKAQIGTLLFLCIIFHGHVLFAAEVPPNAEEVTSPRQLTGPQQPAHESILYGEAEVRERPIYELAQSIHKNRKRGIVFGVVGGLALAAGTTMLVVLGVYNRGPFSLVAGFARGAWGIVGAGLVVVGLIHIFMAIDFAHKAARQRKEADRLLIQSRQYQFPNPDFRYNEYDDATVPSMINVTF